jgi:acyl-CoA synthetase (NDP forming)
LGSGGVLTEIFRDSAVRLAPISSDQAREMVNEVRGLAPIRGYRGLPEGDVDALVDAIVNMSALADVDSVKEAEINPMLVRKNGHGVVAVDGLILRMEDMEKHGG